MELWNKRKKTAAAFGVFLGFMLLCTLISKGIYASGLPRITTVYPEKMGIAHIVEVEGVVEKSREEAFFVPPDLMVETVFVQAGETVSANSPLFRICKDTLQEDIVRQKQEIRELELINEGIEENKLLSSMKNETEKNRAVEDYINTGKEQQLKVDNAKEELEQAQDELQEHLKNEPEVTSDSKRNREREDYSEWEQKGRELQKEVNNAQIRLSEAQGSVSSNDAEEEHIKQLKAELEEAEKKLEEYRGLQMGYPDFEQEDVKKEEWKSKKKELEQKCEDAQIKYEECLREQEKALLEANRKMEDSHANETADYTDEINKIKIEQLKEELQINNDILNHDGIIYSKREGIITAVNISAGGQTSQNAPLIYADPDAPLQFTAVITPEQRKYVDQGDFVILKTGGRTIGEKEVEYITADTSDPSLYRIIITLEDGEADIGQSAQMTAQALSESYSCCIPVQALHKQDERYFVYVMEEKQTVLGVQLVVRAQQVKVLDQNEDYAAIEGPVIDQNTEIVMFSSKQVKDGDVVRFQE